MNHDTGPETAHNHEPTQTGPGPDAATYTATKKAAPCLGLLLLPTGTQWIPLPHNDHEMATLTGDLVGDPHFDRITATRELDFWVGDSSPEHSDLNPVATKILTDLLNDIITGDYAAPDTDRDHARRLLAGGQVVMGPCLVLGADDNTGTSRGVPQSLLDWIDHKAQQLTERLLSHILGPVGAGTTSGATFVIFITN